MRRGNAPEHQFQVDPPRSQHCASVSSARQSHWVAEGEAAETVLEPPRTALLSVGMAAAETEADASTEGDAVGDGLSVAPGTPSMPVTPPPWKEWVSVSFGCTLGKFCSARMSDFCLQDRKERV